MAQFDQIMPSSHPPGDSATRQRVGRRSLLGGMAALGVAGIVGVSRSLAQEASPTSTDDDAVDGTSAVTGKSAQASEDYEFFIAQLAVNLGIGDPATVDSAVRDALKSMIDEQLAAGDISQNDAEVWTTAIDESAAPLKMVCRFGRDGDGRHGNRNDDDGDDTSLPSTEATPSI